jgi:ferredoxin-thioredoxin reductase catalytic chain
VTKSPAAVSENGVDQLVERLQRDAQAGGYHLNSDPAFTRALARGLLVNQSRYGYPACPCRLAAGNKEEDLDIICPCDYRDADVAEFGACYCALYVSAEIAAGRDVAAPIPERRLPLPERRRPASTVPSAPRTETAGRQSSVPVWRCRVCGYLCARDGPPEVCPICKAKKERFEVFPL